MIRPALSRPAGFSLVELLIALALGLILVLGVVQIFIGTRQSFVVQQHTAAMQENARFMLSRIARELRMVNVYGCLDLSRLPAPIAATVPSEFAVPVSHSADTLTILTAVPNAEQFDAQTTRSASDFGARWLIVTDCQNALQLRIGTDDVVVRPGDVLIPVRQIDYQLADHSVRARFNGAGNYERLIDGVVAMDVSFGLAASAELAHVDGGYVSSVDSADFDRIRSIRMVLQLSDNPADPQAGSVLTARYSMVAALRNRMD